MRLIFLIFIFLPATLFSYPFTLKCDPRGTRGNLTLTEGVKDPVTIDTGDDAKPFNPQSLAPGLYGGKFFPMQDFPHHVYLLIHPDLPAGFLVITNVREYAGKNFIWVNFVDMPADLQVKYNAFDHYDERPKCGNVALYTRSKIFSIALSYGDKVFVTLHVNQEKEGLKVYYVEKEELLNFKGEDDEVVDLEDDVVAPEESMMTQSFLGSMASSFISWMSGSSRPVVAPALINENLDGRSAKIRKALHSDAIFGVVGWDIGSNAPHHIKCSDDFIQLTFGSQVTEALTFALTEIGGDGVRISFKAKVTGESPLAKARLYMKNAEGKVVEFLNPYFDVKRLDLKRSDDFQDYEIWVQGEEEGEYKIFWSNNPDMNEDVVLVIKEFKIG